MVVKKAAAAQPAGGNRSLAAFAASVEKHFGGQKVSNGLPPVIVPTGSVAIDWGLRVGGLQLGKVYEILGPKDSGKSTLGISAMIQHRLMFPGRGVGYINMEDTFSPRRATAMGLDCSDEAKAAGHWFPMLPDHSEDVSDMARYLISSGFLSCIVVDSIGAMESDRVLQKSAEDASKTVTPNSKIITQMTKALSREARRNQCTVLLINQPRAVVGSQGIPDQSAGPKAMQHATTVKIEMKALGGEDNDRKLRLPGEPDALVVSVKTRARFPRMKNGLPGRVVETFINKVATDLYGPPGFDFPDEYLTLGVRDKLIKVGGSYYTFPDGTQFQGREKAARYLRENPDACKALRAAIQFDTPTDVLDDVLDDDQEGSEG